MSSDFQVYSPIVLAFVLAFLLTTMRSWPVSAGCESFVRHFPGIGKPGPRDGMAVGLQGRYSVGHGVSTREAKSAGREVRSAMQSPTPLIRLALTVAALGEAVPAVAEDFYAGKTDLDLDPYRSRRRL